MREPKSRWLLREERRLFIRIGSGVGPQGVGCFCWPPEVADLSVSDDTGDQILLFH